MRIQKVDEATFIDLCRTLNSASKVAGATGISVRNVLRRRERIRERTGEWLPLDGGLNVEIIVPDSQTRTEVELNNGCVMVASDAHYYPEQDTTAHRAFVFLAKQLKPEVIIMNGDSFDGATVSRYPRIGWDKSPTLKDEMDAVSFRLEEIRQASKNTKHLHTWGNHDFRFNNYLSAHAEPFEGVRNFRFEDHFPGWNFSMSVMVNQNTMIKHRYHGGVHATWNNLLKSGTSIVTGHLHTLDTRRFTDYNGTRYAVDTGTLACPTGEQFKYAEDNPKNQRSGFAVLVYIEGQLMPPELCEVLDEEEGLCWFRGSQFKV